MGTQQEPTDNAPHPAERQPVNKALSTIPQQSPAVPVAPGETSSSAIAAREKASIEARFLKAMHQPRDFDMARLRILKACSRPRFAEVARYAKPVGRDKVFGLSIRFAEEARILWGNMDVTTMVVFDDDSRRIYRVVGVDLETNATDSVDVIVEKFVERRQVRDGMEVIGQRANTTGQIVYKVRATEDDLVVKANAQISKAKRNVILSLIPADVKEECEEQVIATQRDGDAKDPDAAKRRIVDAFYGLGVNPAQIGELLGHSLEQVNPAELTLLRSYYTTLKDGEATWSEIFEAHTAGKRPTAEATTTAGAPTEAKGTEGLKARVAAAKGPAATATTAPAKCPTCLEVLPNHRPDCPMKAAVNDDMEEDRELVRRENAKR